MQNAGSADCAGFRQSGGSAAADLSETLVSNGALGELVPGILGLITKRPHQWAEAQLLRMLAAMRHEPFYRVGTWIDESLGVYAGWTVIEDSFADGMPLRDRRQNRTLIFSGEEYGHRNSTADGN